MSEPGERYVCDLTWVMRTRLLCGLYSSRAVPPRWRRLAQAYCLTVAVALSVYIGLLLLKASPLYPAILALEYLLAIFISFWTGDEYIYSFFTLNEKTDVTLDARMIFDGFQKQIKKAYIVTLFFVIVYFGTCIAAFHDYGFVVFTIIILPAMVLETVGISMSTSKLLVTWLFDARLLVLKRRLQRYGFRAVGRAPPQPYCQVYDEILQGLSATDNPLKFVLFVDLIFGCIKTISHVIVAVRHLQLQISDANFDASEAVATNLCHFLTFCKILVIVFGHVALLESAAAHCQDMALFTVTQLIKNPTEAERRRIRDFLRALERRGARYRVLRALPVDARLVLRALDFCFAQIVVFVNTITPH